MALIQTVHLSMANFKSAPVVPAVQNDTDRQVKMILDDYTLTSGLTGKIAFERSDGTHYETAAELVLADNAFTADIDQALTQPGRTMVQLKVTDTLTVSTFSFVIFVEADNSGTVTPQEGIDLVTAVEAAEDAADRAEAAVRTLDGYVTEEEMTAAISANVDATLSVSGKAADSGEVGGILITGETAYGKSDLSKHDTWYIRSNGTVGGSYPGNTLYWIACQPSTQYSVAIPSAYISFGIAYSSAVPVGDMQLSGVVSSTTATTLFIKTGANAAYLVISAGTNVASITIKTPEYRFESVKNATINKKRQFAVYFSSGQIAFFEKISRGGTTEYTAKFPNGTMVIYSEVGKIAETSSYQGSEFSIPLQRKLVYDLDDGTIKIVYVTASGNYVDLFANCGNSVYGVLYSDFIANDDRFSQEWYDTISAYRNSDNRFLLFSDVHGSSANVTRILNKAKSLDTLVDAVINGGDIVTTVLTDGTDWYNTLVNASSVDVLNCVGNHDTWINQTTWEQADKADVYAALIAPMVSRVSDIVQPTGAADSNLCYYYKDYSTLRVIVLDAMITDGNDVVGWWDASELSWFESVLAEAKTNNKSVVCVAHPPFDKAIALRDDDSPVNSWLDYRTASYYDTIHVPQAALDAVADFITGGGDFICWLSGHTHVDNVLTATGYTGQLMINIGSAKYSQHLDGTNNYASSVSREKWFDCFDYICIDKTHKLIKVVRFGYNMDASMRVRSRFCYDYATKKLLSAN